MLTVAPRPVHAVGGDEAAAETRSGFAELARVRQDGLGEEKPIRSFPHLHAFQGGARAGGAREAVGGGRQRRVARGGRTARRLQVRREATGAEAVAADRRFALCVVSEPGGAAVARWVDCRRTLRQALSEVTGAAPGGDDAVVAEHDGGPLALDTPLQELAPGLVSGDVVVLRRSV